MVVEARASTQGGTRDKRVLVTLQRRDGNHLLLDPTFHRYEIKSQLILSMLDSLH